MVTKDFAQRRPYNAALDFVDANVARGLGDKVAFLDGTRSLTFKDLQQGTLRFAAALRGLGLTQESRIALLLHDTVDFPIAFWGAIRAGADEPLIESLKAHVKESAGLWKYPRWIEFRSELPKTATGKIQRFKLRKESAASDSSGKAA